MTSVTRADASAPPASTTPPATSRHVHQRLAVLIAGVIALLYGLLSTGVLPIAGATDAERGILGVAGAVFAVLAGLLWWRCSRVLWVGAVALQLLMGWMYLAIAPDRDPSFEVWGVTIRVLSLTLVLVLVRLLVVSRGDRTERRS
jgi:hypothetical protein